MKRTKKIFISLFAIISMVSFSFGAGLNTGPKSASFDGDSTAQMGGTTITEINQGGKTLTDKLEGILHLPQKDEYITSLGYVTALIQITVNWLLGILAFIALVYMLYSGFLIFSSGSDDKGVAKGKKGISTAAIALAGIGLSWLIISAMIWFINLISKSN